MSSSLESINLDFNKSFHTVFKKPELIQSFLTKRSNKFDEIIRKAVSQQLSYIIINDIFVGSAVDDSNQLNIQLEFSVALQPDTFDSLLLQFNMGAEY